MLKQLTISLAATAIACGGAMATGPTVQWETLGNSLNREGAAVYHERYTITNVPGAFNRLAFCVAKHEMHPLNPLDTIIELLPGYYAVGSPRFSNIAPGDSVIVDIITHGRLRNAFNTPDGVHLVKDGKPITTLSSRAPIIARREQWQTLPGDGRDPMIYGPEAYATNDSIRSSWHPGPYMQIPTPKSVNLTGGTIKCPAVVTRAFADNRHDYYRVTIDGDTAVVYTNSACPAAIKAMVERRLCESADNKGRVPRGIIEDWADLPYRGLMLDIARNYTPLEHVKEIIALMSRYGLNVLHFHLGDDEGWRLEIPGIPELTEVGSRRGYATTDDVPYLKGIYSGNGNPDDPANPANGYITADEYVGLLKYARGLGIDIIPEFDSPGHSRAAIRAMEHRYRLTGDSTLRLIHDGDTSQYSTAQYFHDNLMNPALEGPYRFWGMVMDGIMELHRRAEVPLRAIHIGGDEVPEHAWDGSDIANKFMADNGLTHQRQLHAHFVERLARLAAERGIKIAGWQEIALNHSPEYDATVLPVVEAVNSWTNAGDQSSRMAKSGYPVVLSNVDYLYLDQTPSTHPEETGFTWGGIVDEFRPSTPPSPPSAPAMRMCTRLSPASPPTSLPRPCATTAWSSAISSQGSWLWPSADTRQSPPSPTANILAHSPLRWTVGMLKATNATCDSRE